jgi:hypothetical protein
MSNAAYAAAKKEKFKALMKAAGKEEKSLARKVAESSLYDGSATARFLLTQLVVLAMDKDDNYPEDAPDSFKADKEGWCWMSQFRLSLRVGVSESQIHRLLKEFKEDGVTLTRTWIDDHGTPHTEYKVVESVVDAFQRPSQNREVDRPPRYKVKRAANKGSFSFDNQPSKKKNEDDA